MRFVFHIRYPASFFTVVDNLSLWSPYSHRQYYVHWVEKYGLTEEQRSLLNQYSRIREKYPWHKMEPIFMYADVMKEAWKRACSIMEDNEVENLRKVFNAFKESFDKEWQHHDYLRQRKKTFEGLYRQCSIEQAFAEVIRFYDWKETVPEIDVHLLYNPSLHTGGGGCHAGVQLEVRQDEREELIRQDFAVLLHEAFHILELRNGTRERLRALGGEWMRDVLTQAEGDVCQIVTEAVMGSLIPHGIVAEKYLGLPHKDILETQKIYWKDHLQKTKDDSDKRRTFIQILLTNLTISLLPITKSYMEEKKTVWDNYWRKSLELYFQIRTTLPTSQSHKTYR